MNEPPIDPPAGAEWLDPETSAFARACRTELAEFAAKLGWAAEEAMISSEPPWGVVFRAMFLAEDGSGQRACWVCWREKSGVVRSAMHPRGSASPSCGAQRTPEQSTGR